MQFLEKIPKILANIARVSLIALALAHDCAQCDVVPANTIAGQPLKISRVLFAQLSAVNAGNFAAGVAIPVNVLGLFNVIGFPFGPFPDEANAMPGFAAFFPAGARQVNQAQLYLGMMQTGDGAPMIPNNVGAANFFTVSDSSHTERQLIVAALNNGGVTINGAAWAGIVAAARAVANAGGDVYVFTRLAPCVNNATNNGGLVCVEYYRQVTIANPSLNFHIYFPSNSGRIGKDIGNTDFIRLVTHLATQLQLLANTPIREGRNLSNFRITVNAGNNVLQVLTNPQQYTSPNAWADIATQPAAGGAWVINPAMTAVNRRRFFNRVNNYLENTPAQVENFFNAVYGNPGRINYHPV